MEEGERGHPRSKMRELIEGRTQNWSKIFTDQLDQKAFENENKWRMKAIKEKNNMDTLMARLRVNKLLIDKIRQRLKTSFHSVRRTVENASASVFPTQDWPDYCGSQAFCDYCRKPALAGCLECNTCTIIYHDMCYKTASKSRKAFKPSEIVDLDLDDEERFICIHCEESLINEHQTRRNTLKCLIEKRKKDDVSKFLCRFLYTYGLRRRFLKIKSGLTAVQSMIRRNIDRRSFLTWKRMELHVLVLELRKIQLTPVIGTVTVTLVDPMRGNQIMRIDKAGNKWSEEGECICFFNFLPSLHIV
jgi:hypothetical protein